MVFEVFADTLLENISVKSFGGDKSKEWSSGGSCGVVLRKGNLTIKKCVILSEQGTGVAVDNDSKSNGGHTDISQCVIQGSKDSKSSLAVQLSGAEDKVATMTIAGCTIVNCKVAIKAKGQAKIFFDKTNTVKHCSKETTVENGGQIISGEVAAALVPTPAVEDPAVSPGAKKKSPTSGESAKSSVQVPKVCAETTNFARYCRLLLDVGRDVLAAVFKGSFKKEKNKQWTESCGQSFLNHKFPDGASQRQLGKHLVNNIRAGKCEEWDITLLSSLLLNTPGYIKDKPDAKKAAQTLRDERNSLAHSADFARQSLNEQEFNVKWEAVKVELDVLMEQLLPAEKEAHRCKIDEIATENFGQSSLEPLFERVQQDIKHIQDLAEDASNKADEALRKAANAASISQVHKAMDAKLESLMKKDGQVGPNQLPRDVTLSNQKRYRLIKQVGKGGMGTVFEAKLINSESESGKLALKICHADQSRAEREADIMKRLGTLKHENIVKFLDNALDDKHLVIIMEHLVIIMDRGDASRRVA